MKKTVIFLALSLILHILLLMINIHTETPRKDTTKIEIIPKERPVEPQPEPEPEPVEEPVEDQPQPPRHVIPPTPDPGESTPVLMEPEPQITPEPETPIEPVETEEPARPPTPTVTERPQRPVVEPDPTPPDVDPIIPEVYDPQNPPAPLSLSDLLQERNSIEGEIQGPDRRIDDIVRDYLREQQELGPDDTVSFHHMSERYDSYFYRFARSLYAEWRYPPESAQRREAGIVRVTFSITKDGRITNIHMLESSGYPALDREVMRTLRTMNSVALPDSYGVEMLNINGYFIYSLSGGFRLY